MQGLDELALVRPPPLKFAPGEPSARQKVVFALMLSSAAKQTVQIHRAYGASKVVAGLVVLVRVSSPSLAPVNLNSTSHFLLYGGKGMQHSLPGSASRRPGLLCESRPTEIKSRLIARGSLVIVLGVAPPVFACFASLHHLSSPVSLTTSVAGTTVQYHGNER